MPVFEGLLPRKHNANLMDLLFIMSHWHGLAKLRQHTDLSLDILNSVTIQLGNSLRKFRAQTCAAYDTKELKREEGNRLRRATKKSLVGNAEITDTTDLPPPNSDVTNLAGPSENSIPSKPATKSKPLTGKKRVTLSLNTYKDHSLGDYVDTIRRYGDDRFVFN